MEYWHKANERIALAGRRSNEFLDLYCEAEPIVGEGQGEYRISIVISDSAEILINLTKSALKTFKTEGSRFIVCLILITKTIYHLYRIFRVCTKLPYN